MSVFSYLIQGIFIFTTYTASMKGSEPNLCTFTSGHTSYMLSSLRD